MEGKTIVIKNSNNEIVGTGWYLNGNRESEWRHLVVKSEYRGKGLSKLLMFLWLKMANDYNLKKGNTWININNDISLKLHKKLGFEESKIVSIQYVY